MRWKVHSPITISAVLFDFGGVLVHWDAWLLYGKIFPTQEVFKEFLTESRFYECLDRSDRGEKFGDLVEEMEGYAPHCAENARLFCTRFMEAIGGIQEDIAQIVRELSDRHVPVYGLTNWSAETFPEVRACYSVFEYFTDIIVSGVEGLVKPDPRIFDLAVQRWNLVPIQTVFIDDQLENVGAAQRHGFHSLLYRESSELRSQLEELIPSIKRFPRDSHA